jgi:hypothetical protein
MPPLDSSARSIASVLRSQKPSGRRAIRVNRRAAITIWRNSPQLSVALRSSRSAVPCLFPVTARDIHVSARSCTGTGLRLAPIRRIKAL